MPRFVIERLFDQAGPPTPAASQHTKRLIATEFTDITWEHSHVAVDDENGYVRTFCIYSGSSEERMRAHAGMIHPHTVVNVYELATDVTPDDIPEDGQPVPDTYV